MRSVLGVVLILLLSATAAAAAGVGTVAGLSGSCFVESGGNRRALALGAAVEVGDIVDVAPTGKLRLRMEDGSIVAVAPGTRLTIATYTVAPGGQRQEAKLSLAHGLLRAIVSPVRQPAVFEVDTATSAAAARSTDWFVEATPAMDRVVVLGGSVAVTGKATGHSVVVPARRETSVAAGQDPLPPRAATRAEIAGLLALTEFPKPTRVRSRRDGAATPGYAAPPPEERGPYQPYQPNEAPPYQPNEAPPYQPYSGPPPPPYQPYSAPPPPQQYQPYPTSPYSPGSPGTQRGGGSPPGTQRGGGSPPGAPRGSGAPPQGRY